jgi:hypothetical protein
MFRIKVLQDNDPKTRNRMLSWSPSHLCDLGFLRRSGSNSISLPQTSEGVEAMIVGTVTDICCQIPVHYSRTVYPDRAVSAPATQPSNQADCKRRVGLHGAFDWKRFLLVGYWSGYSMQALFAFGLLQTIKARQ